MESARGELPRELASPSLLPIRPIANNVRTIHFRITFLLQSRQSPGEQRLQFTLRPVETSAEKGQNAPGEGIQVLREILSLTVWFHAVPAREFNKNQKSRCYENSIPSSSSAASAASGVKSDDRCAPASNIKPEIKAQNIRATETENACP